MNNPVKTLLLSQAHLVAAGVMDMTNCVDVIEEVFRLLGEGDYIMGGPQGDEHGQMLFFPKEPGFPGMPAMGPDRRFMSMVGYLGGKFKICGEKWYGSNIENVKRGLPRSVLTVILNDADTGIPFTIMSGNLISAMRTGAVPGVASKYLAKPGASTVGVIGGGVMNKACLLAIKTALPQIRQAYLYDILPDKGAQWAQEQSEKIGVAISCVDSMEAAIRPADIITIAASGTVPPRIESEWLKPGCLVAFTGVGDMDLDAYSENTVVADNWKMHEAFLRDGEEHPEGVEILSSIAPSSPLLMAIAAGNYDGSKVVNLGDIVCGKVNGRKSDDEIIMFITGGMPVHDIAWGKTVYDNAVRKGLGTEFVFFEEAVWR